jgi:hypothetical protein
MIFAAAAIVVAQRATAGALRSPLAPSALLLAAAAILAAAVAIRLGWLLPLGPCRAGRSDLAVMVATSFTAAVLCGGLCLPPETSLPAVMVFRVLFVVEEGWAWLWFFRKWSQADFHPETQPTRLPVDEDTPDPFVTQQITRRLNEDGVEELAGWLRLTFAAGQRTGSAHVAFCPPLAVAPQVTVEQIEGPEARIKTAQLLPYGARFDLKLAAAADEDTSVLLQFTARTAGAK